MACSKGVPDGVLEGHARWRAQRACSKGMPDARSEACSKGTPMACLMGCSTVLDGVSNGMLDCILIVMVDGALDGHT